MRYGCGRTALDYFFGISLLELSLLIYILPRGPLLAINLWSLSDELLNDCLSTRADDVCFFSRPILSRCEEAPLPFWPFPANLQPCDCLCAEELRVFWARSLYDRIYLEDIDDIYCLADSAALLFLLPSLTLIGFPEESIGDESSPVLY